MEIDISATTTCSPSLLEARDVDAQGSYFPLLAYRVEETITAACFSPIPYQNKSSKETVSQAHLY